MSPGCMDKCRNEQNISGKCKPYDNGFRRCTMCNIYIKTDELRCYCCKLPLRTVSYRSRAKRLRVVVRY